MQFVTCLIGDQAFGLDIRYVREINRAVNITPVPLEPAYIRGLINLRGQVVTLIDLRSRLGLPPSEEPGLNHNIIIKHGSKLRSSFDPEDGRLDAITDPAGLVVDDVGDVIHSELHEVEHLPANMGALDARFLAGLLKLEDTLIPVLDLPQLLTYHPNQQSERTLRTSTHPR